MDDSNDLAYVQYLDDISANSELKMGDNLLSSLPTDVSGVAATYNSDIQVTVIWSDNSSDESGFKINRRDDTGSGWGSYTQIGAVAAGVENFVDNVANNASNPPVANEKYQYQVLAYNSAGNGNAVTDASSIITTPTAPTIGAPIVNSSTSITWAWTDNANFEDSYRVDYVTGAATDADGLTAGSSSWADTDLTPNTQYAIHVHAYQTDRGESAASTNSSAVYTLANIPTSLALVADSATQITASWNANSNPGTTEYYIENTTAGTNSGWITDTSWVSENLTCRTTYVFKVKARNSDNTETVYTSIIDKLTSACPAPVADGPSSNTVYISPSEGGTVSQAFNSGERAEVTIQPDSVPDTINISIIQRNPQGITPIKPLPTNSNIVGNINDINVWDGYLRLHNLDQPATITLWYTDQEMNLSDVKENTLKIYYWDETANKWLPLTSIIDIINNKVSAQTSHFSLFALLGEQTDNKLTLPLIKLTNDPKVYAVGNNNYKRHIPNEASFLSYNYQWNDIKTVPVSEFNFYPTTELIKLATDSKVYKTENNLKRWITNEAVFNALGLSWAAITDINNTEFNFYSTGEPIKSTDNTKANYQFTSLL